MMLGERMPLSEAAAEIPTDGKNVVIFDDGWNVSGPFTTFPLPNKHALIVADPKKVKSVRYEKPGRIVLVPF